MSGATTVGKYPSHADVVRKESVKSDASPHTTDTTSVWESGVNRHTFIGIEDFIKRTLPQCPIDIVLSALQTLGRVRANAFEFLCCMSSAATITVNSEGCMSGCCVNRLQSVISSCSFCYSTLRFPG